MTRTTIRLLLASLLAATCVVGGKAQDDPPTAQAKPAPTARDPLPVVKVLKSTTNEKSRPGRSPASLASADAQRDDRPPQNGRQRSSASPQVGDRRGGKSGNSPERRPGAASTDRRPNSPPHSAHGSGSGRKDSGRPKLGISIGPGGVQIFRGDSRSGPRTHQTRPNYYGRDPWQRSPRGGTSFQWSPNRGWGFSIGTRPTVVVPSNPVVIPQPQVVPASPEPPAPTEDELAGMPGIELRGLLLYSIDRLYEEPGSLSTGAGWQSYLQIAELQRLVPPPTLAPAPPDATTPETTSEPMIDESNRKKLTEILQTYDSVQKNAEYQQISQLWGFATTRAALREFLIPPGQRLRNQLSLSVELLGEELQQFGTGATWSKFLKLADAKRIAAIRPTDVSADDRKQLQSIVSVFDSTTADPRYRMISELLGFRMTLHLTRSYLTQVSLPSPLPAPAPQ